MALPSEVKNNITKWYKALQNHIPNFISRAPQREMIAHVANSLNGENGRHLIVEAPTGVGKTLSYLIPGIAVAQNQEKKLVVSTANIALQDQIFNKDLPLIQKIIPEIKFIAVFGRARYVCPRNLTYLSPKNDGQTGFLDLFEDDEFNVNQNEAEFCLQLYDNLIKNKWDGVRDHHSESISDSLWQKMSTDKQNCLGRNCYHFRECPFYLSRKDIENSDIIITNHALVLAALENENTLPPPEKMLLVLDEGHHIADVARGALELHAEISLFQSLNQLDGFSKIIKQATTLFDPPEKPPLLKNIERFDDHIEQAKELADHLMMIFDEYLPNDEGSSSSQSTLFKENNKNQEPLYIFELGQLPEEFQLLCQALQTSHSRLASVADFFLTYFNESSNKLELAKVQRFQLQISRFFGYFDNLSQLWQLACKKTSSSAPISKWFSRSANPQYMGCYFHCAALRVSDQLSSIIWDRIPHAVITSATLRSLNSFHRIEDQTGLNPEAKDQFIALSSPFAHHKQGKIIIPNMKTSPVMEDEEKHLQEMLRFFNYQYEESGHKAFLVLFNSQRAMKRFIELCDAYQFTLLVQGDKPRARLIELHQENIKNEEKSVLIGMSSFSEGLDLRGDFLTQVHIHKIGFPPMTNPIILTEEKWLKNLKKSSFDLLSLPQASFTLIQQVGRLIRSHDCFGEIVIYDNRLLNKPYGKRLLASLPSFPLEQVDVPN
ncbi:ATP-dependent DNA helicase DinG [Thorsellia kenyensis]|uniref:ATP-dependent DNA helicase DinG n=1 Tax=Thorsellia kenyensis TaxID=1549888 RepID=A0ABV6CE75_9GAMM